MVSGLLDIAGIGGRSGRGVRVAVVDSGVHADHPHVQGVAGGVAIDARGRRGDDYVDRLGHGTAVTAVIREKAPDAELYAVKVFDRELATSVEALDAAIRWSIEQQIHIVNLSLGTANQDHESVLRNAVRAAGAAGVTIVAAAPQPEARWLPGAFPAVISVALDWTMPRDSCAARVESDGCVRFTASGYPRPIPGVPPERNLRGLSFAVANATGFLALILQGNAAAGAANNLRALLAC